MRPKLPTRPTRDVNVLACSWVCQLLDCVWYAMTHPVPDNLTLFSDANDTFRVRRLPGGGDELAVESAAAGYNGYFKVVAELRNPAAPASESNPLVIKVIDGANPTSGLAGMTDLTFFGVAAVELAYQAAGTVYLVATWDAENNEYDVEISYSLPSEGAYGYVILATIAGGVVTQRWTDNTVYFGVRYFL